MGNGLRFVFQISNFKYEQLRPAGYEVKRVSANRATYHWLCLRVWREPTERFACAGPPLSRRTSVAVPESSHEYKTLSIYGVRRMCVDGAGASGNDESLTTIC